MRITLETGDRLELRGTPQGRGLVFGFVCCTGILIVSLLFSYVLYSQSRSLTAALGPGIASVFMLFMMTCLFLLSLKRERLTLDKVTRTATYETWSLLVGTHKSKTHPFDRIHAVAVERSLESPGGGKGFPIEVTKARLLILGPRGGRRAIDLDEVQSGNPQPVEVLAQQVATFLDKPLQALGSHDEPPPRRKSRD